MNKVTAIIILFYSLSACAEKIENKIIGKWKTNFYSEELVFEFNEGGYVTPYKNGELIVSKGIQEKISWIMTDDFQIKLEDGNKGMSGYINESGKLILQIGKDITVPENKPNRIIEFIKVQ